MTTVIAIGFALSALSPAQDANAQSAGKQRTERGQLVRQIVLHWGGHVSEAYGASVHRWAMDMAPVFSKAPLGQLRNAARARTFTEMNNALLVGKQAEAAAPSVIAPSGQIVGSKLGDIDQDLIFVPVAPCRIIDTRVAGGAIAANTTRGFDVTAVSNYSFQGGDSSNCGGVGAAGSFAAAAINFTVVTPSAAGYITAFPYLGTQPLAATLNYTAGDIRGNFAIVKLDQGASANELSVYTFAQTHLVADIVGYYRNPGAPTLDCVATALTSLSIAAGATGNVNAPACASGYTHTGTNCESSSWDMPFVFNNAGTCSAKNNGAGSALLRAGQTCCKPVFN